MKVFKTMLVTFLAFTLVACGGDDDDGNGINIGDGCTASWKVNGEDYEENDMALCVFLDNTLNLSSSTTGGDFLMQIDPISATGTFDADPTNLNQTVVITMRLNDGTQLIIKEGQIVVTELSSSKAKGTFSGSFFDGTDLSQTASFEVTNGVFEANF